MKEIILLKYECLDKFQKIVTKCTDDETAKLLVEMFDLIAYQMNQIKEQRIEIVGLKHKEAWKRYDLPDSRFIPSVDKPPKSGNMSC